MRGEMQQSLLGLQKSLSGEWQSAMGEQNRQLQTTLQTQLRHIQRQVTAATPVPEGRCNVLVILKHI